MISLVPKVFQIETTTKCNLQCIMCPHPFLTRPKIHIDLDLFRLIVDRDMVGQNGLIGIHGLGEPFLNPDICLIIGYLSHRNFKPEVCTNCTIMSENLANRLIDVGLHTIWFCIDAANKDDYEKIRLGANFDKVIRNIERFIFINERLGNPIRVFVQKVGALTDNIDNERFLEMWAPYGRLKFVDSWAGTMNLEIIENPPSKRIPCEEPWKRVMILVNGDVVPCCRDWNGQYVYGNLLEKSLEEVWAGEKVQQLRDEMLSGDYLSEPCRSCNEWYIPMDRDIVSLKEL